ncbi:TPA: response regulator transcription factor [Escherichia coli]|nr:response regulator transcription factor [Escherichia coli]HCQ0091567.1 response regulator transcription factor [Escherichia coli]
MRDDYFSFDRVLVMDRYPLTGLGLCALADGVVGRACSEHVTTLRALYHACQRYEGERLLLITELISNTESLREGLELLRELGPQIRAGLYRVVVCTDLADPLLLKVIANEMPTVVVLRSEALSVLQDAIRLAGTLWPEMLLSPAVAQGLALARGHKLTPRELEWLVTQADGLDLKASAKAMKVSYKTVSVWRRNIALTIGSAGKGAFNQRLAKVRRSVTGELILTGRATLSGNMDDHPEERL